MGAFLSEADVAARLTMRDTLDAVRESFVRLAHDEIRTEPRTQLLHPGGYFAAICAADEGLGLASVKSYTVIDGELRGFLISLTSTRDGTPKLVLEADHLTAMRTGAASGVAAAALARPGATSVGIIGVGRQAPFQLDAIRTALPEITTAVAWARRPEPLRAFCKATGASAAGDARAVAACDIVVAATTSATPVISGEALRAGALVIAIGGDHHGDRELDDEVIRRAGLVTCDSIATSRDEAADLWAPVEAGLLDWDDVVALQDVITGRHAGRASDDEIVVFKSSGLGAWDIAAASVLAGI